MPYAPLQSRRSDLIRHGPWRFALILLSGLLLAACGGGGDSGSSPDTGTDAPVARLDSTLLDFGQQQVGTASAVQFLTLTNTGNAPLSVTGVVISGPDQAAFAQSSGCVGSMTPGGSCTISVWFTPTGPGAASATLGLSTNAASNPTARLSGNGVTLIAISPASATVPFSGQQAFSATVTDPSGDENVTWSVVWAIVSCIEPFPCYPPVYHPCSPDCGTVSPASSKGDALVTYTAPSHFESPVPPGCLGACTFFRGIYLQAALPSNGAAISRAPITLKPASIALSPDSASLAINSTQQFTATVTDDLTDSGVTWTLSQNGMPCAPGCGTLAPASTPSGGAIAYTAPENVPALPLVTIRATSIAQPGVSADATITVTTVDGIACGAGSGNESLLQGQYAFIVQGTDVDMAGSFTADGSGKVTTGEVDVLEYLAPSPGATIDHAASFYAVGTDHRGCLGLAISGVGTRYLRFALGAANASGIATSGRIMTFDDPTRMGSSGTIHLQDATSFAAGRFSGDYAIGLIGNFPDRISIAGSFAADGRSAIESGLFDVSSGQAPAIANPVSLARAGTFICCSVNGRGTMTLPLTVAYDFANTTLNLAFYMIDSDEALLTNTQQPHLAGKAIGIPSGQAFSQSSLLGPSVIRTSGFAAELATASSDGIGFITTHDNINSQGTFTTSSTTYAYQVAASGRVTLTGGISPPVLYLVGQNRGFLIGTDPQVLTLGFIEPQAAGPFSNASLSGGFVLGTELNVLYGGTVESGLVNLDGAGSATGTTDRSSSDGSGLQQNLPFNSTYAVSADGTGFFGTDTFAVLISANKLAYISKTSPTPTVTMVER
jgi:Abnormal spindle-like microcephaly-assoc'd, ASPM-SPD-2-Hydin